MRAAPIRMVLTLLTAGLCAVAARAEVLSGEALSAEFAGRTIAGYYLDTGVRFIERYRDDGTISYRDDITSDVGRWSVDGDLFCTFYDNIAGDCWYVRKVRANCLEFFPQSTGYPDLPAEEQALLKPQARAAREGEAITCDSWFGS